MLGEGDHEEKMANSLFKHSCYKVEFITTCMLAGKVSLVDIPVTFGLFHTLICSQAWFQPPNSVFTIYENHSVGYVIGYVTTKCSNLEVLKILAVLTVMV